MRTLPLDRSVDMIPDGASLMIGGFMAVGTPERIIDEIVRQKKRGLTVIANDTAMPGKGIGKLIEAKLVRKVIASHIGLNPEAQRQMMAGELEVELVPQGTLVERIRAGGYGLGNLSYTLTARNFNPVMAMAAETVIACADHIVPAGVISPDHVMTPGPLVDCLIAN